MFAHLNQNHPAIQAVIPGENTFEITLGIDWASDHHDVAVVDDDGRVVARGRVGNDAAGFAQVLTLLAEAGDTAKQPIPVGIETDHGLWVGALRETGRVIYPINPLADLAELFCRAAELAPHGAILHGVAADVTQRDLARAINRMIGKDERTDSLSLLQMLGIDPDTVGNIGGSFTPPATAASGISLSLNKRLSSEKTRKLLDWSPKRTDIGDDIAFGSYAN